MINLTDRPIVVAAESGIDEKIRNSISSIHTAIDKKYGFSKWNELTRRSENSLGKTAWCAFCIYFEPKELPGTSYSIDFIEKLWDFSNIGPRHEGITAAFNKLTPYLARSENISANIGAQLKGFSKLLLLRMWADGVIVLPFTFLLGPAGLKEHGAILSEFETKVAKFFRRYRTDVSHRPANAAALPLSGAEMLYKLGPRVIWATTYHDLKDVDIFEVSQLMRAISNVKKHGHEYGLGGSRPPIALMLREMLVCHESTVSFNEKDLEGLSLWIHSPAFQKTSFEEYLTQDLTLREKRPSAPQAHQKKKQLTALSSAVNHNSIVDYFSKMRGIRRDGDEWLNRGAPYVGREHIDLLSISGCWKKAWASWMKYRKTVQGFESDEGLVRAFNLLCDYLFLYLPWWKELYPNSTVDVPTSPNKFKRAIFVHRNLGDDGLDIPLSEMPLTLLDILPKRLNSVDSRYATLITLIQFFEWVEIGFEDDDSVGGNGYRSPLRKIDLPRVSKKTKTTKVPFSKRVYPHLLFYSYAVEAFGEYLQQLAMSGSVSFSGRTRIQKSFFDAGPTPDQVDDDGRISEEYLEDNPEPFGYIPFISYRGKNYPIHRIPNCYQWAERKFDVSRYGVMGAQITDLWTPHLTTLRMLIGAIETGLRLQGIQWLDVNSWDSLNKRNGVPACYDFSLCANDGHFALPLLVSTDKVKNEPWDVAVVFRVRSCFYREQYFRQSIVESGMDESVWYEGNVDSRFGKITPLFRSQSLAEPVSDMTYSKYWRLLMWGFEEHFNNNVSGDGEFVQFVYLKGTSKDPEPVPDYNDTDLNEIKAINTPHACRATYATNRTGILEASDVAQQLGHQSTVVTAHYTVSTMEIMEEKLAAVEQEIQAGFGASYIRADSPKGALYKSFQEDRVQTIDSFQFAPPIAFWKTEDLDGGQEGVEYLRSSPMSQIRFRETHICPVGESCPTDVLEKIGEPKRCGLCPLAMRCVDHLPAIAAKVNQLKMKVRTDIKRAERLAAAGEPDSSVDALYEAAELDANELVGWQFSHDILLKMLENRPNGGSAEYHVQAPEIVQRHLQAVTSDRSLSQFFLQRIADAKAFPTMADPEIQRIADRYCRYILAGKYQMGVDDDPIAALAGLVKTQMEPLGLTMVDLAAKIDQFEAMNSADSAFLLERRQFMLTDTQDGQE
jgi:hypothetical protein